jgi:uncharacterized protein involved in exopolysaccharide biosynthesis
VRRALEAFFRRPGRFVLLIVLLPIIGLGVGLKLPRTYQVQASVWAIKRFEVIGATGAESDLLATPAETQATALNELLQTHVFDLEVANQTQLVNTLSAAVRANPTTRDDALALEISTRVAVVAQGTNLFTITYSNKSPHIAEQVVAAVINSYGEQSQGLSVVEGQNLLNAYQAQLPAAQKALDAATTAESQYLRQHAAETPAQLANDPQYTTLHADTTQKLAVVQNIQSQIVTLSQEIDTASGGPASLFNVLDKPTVPVQPMSRTRTLLMTAGGGLLLALLACTIYLALLVRRDRALYTAAEVQRATEMRVLLQLPALPANMVAVARQALVTAEAPAASRRKLRGPRA